MEWFSLLIPLAFSIVMALFWCKKVVWWEHLISPAIVLILIFVFSIIGENSVTKDIEFISGYGQSASYEEEWDEEVPCRHPVYKTVTKTDSKGNTYTEEVYSHDEHDYDVDHHPEEWYVSSSIGRYNISKNEFHRLCKTWNNKKFVDMRRDYHSIDGDKYTTFYDNIEDHMLCYSRTQSYENRIQGSKSVFNFEDIEHPRSLGLHEYPSNTTNPILGNCPNKKVIQREIMVFNSKDGAIRQCRVWVLFYKNRSVETAIQQESYWVGGNKNELVVCISLDDDNEIIFSKTFGWTEKDVLKITIDSEIAELKKFDALKVSKIIRDNTKKYWKRKEFSDFEYIEVETPIEYVYTTYIVAFVVSLIVSIFVVTNEETEESAKKAKGRYGNGFRKNRR